MAEFFESKGFIPLESFCGGKIAMRQGQQSQGDSSSNFLWAMVIVIGVVLILWWKQKEAIVSTVFYIRLYEIYVVQVFANLINEVASLLHLPTLNISSISDDIAYITTTPWSQVSFDGLSKLSANVGSWTKYPLAVCSAVLAFFLYFKQSGQNFRKSYSMNSLKSVEDKNWPVITPVVKLDLVKQSLDKGAWAIARLPLDYCKEHNLIRVEPQQGKLVWTVIPSAAQRIFVMQLGPLWRGLNALPPHVQALLVIFLACAHKERKIADGLLSQIAASSASGKLDFSGVRELLRKYQSSRILAWVIPRHAYVGTLMARLLEIARSDGVLATAEFLWLKPLDRRLWYILNSVGRQVAVIEVAGLFAHWLAEKKLGCALRVPTVKMALEGLELDIKETLYIAEGETWQSFNSAA